MSFDAIRRYIHDDPVADGSIGELYGTENFSLLLNSIIRMRQPSVIVELGTGAAATSLMAAEALQHNKKGHLWTIDDGSAWTDPSVRKRCQRALQYEDPHESHLDFVKRLIAFYKLDGYMTPVSLHMENGVFFSPETRIDLLFADATSSGAKECARLLRYYLPRMTGYSSIFIDRASTIHHSFLFLNYMVDQLNRGRIPVDLLVEIGEEEHQNLRLLVEHSAFSIVHLTETAAAKLRSPTQNSRAWIQIEPNDHLHHNKVVIYM